LAEWVEMTATLLQDVYYAKIAPGRVGQRDMAVELKDLAQSTSRASVVSAIEAVKNLKAGLQQNVNRQLALEAMFLTEASQPG